MIYIHAIRPTNNTLCTEDDASASDETSIDIFRANVIITHSLGRWLRLRQGSAPEVAGGWPSGAPRARTATQAAAIRDCYLDGIIRHDLLGSGRAFPGRERDEQVANAGKWTRKQTFLRSLPVQSVC